MKKERKCDSCHKWLTNPPTFCPLCGKYVDHRKQELDQKENRLAAEEAREEADFASKSPRKQTLIRIGRIFRAVYMAIMGFLGWILFWLGG